MRSTGSRVFPARFAECTFDKYSPVTDTQKSALAAARKLAVGEIGSLVLVGPPGVGKSHLAAAVVHDIRSRQDAAYTLERDAILSANPSARWPRLPVDPMWENVADLIVGLRMEMGWPDDDRDSQRSVLQASRHPALVVLDDLGREKSSDWTGEIIYSLVNARYENQRPTLVTSNLAPAELRASPYWPVISRLAEDGELVKIVAPDHRLRKAVGSVDSP